MEPNNAPQHNISSNGRSRRAISCDILVKKLFGIPTDAQGCRLVLISGASAYMTSFLPVNHNGVVDVGETIPFVSKETGCLNCWTNCQDCRFRIQIRMQKEDDSFETKTLGEVEVDIERYIESEKDEHLFCLPEDSSPFESLVLPYIQVTLRPRRKRSSERNSISRPETPPKNSNQLADIQESILTHFDTDVTSKWRNKDRGKKTTLLDGRRARYAGNWSKMNSSLEATDDVAEKRISMETRESLMTLQSQKAFTRLPKGLASSYEEPSFKTSMPLRIAATSIPREEKERQMDKKITQEDLVAENRMLKASIARLESDLTLSRSETTSANARVSVLSNELVTARMQTQESLKSRERKDSLYGYSPRSFSRQSSTTSDTLETASKLSLSHRGSGKSAISRSGSLTMAHEASKAHPTANESSEELEAQKVALAEKLAQKEETIAKLEKQVKFSMSQLRQMEAGMDGVETRYDQQIEAFKVEMAKKYQSLFQKGQELSATNQKNEQGMDQLQKDIHKVLKMIQEDIHTLESDIGQKQLQNSRLGEEKRILQQKYEAKCEETEKYIGELKAEIEDWKNKNEELRNQISKLRERETFLNLRLADLTIDPPEGTNNDNTAEINSLNERISSLESGIAEYESKNRNLMDELRDARAKLEQSAASGDMDAIAKENAELKQHCADVSEKLADLEQDNKTLKEDAEQLNMALHICSSLEEEVQSLRKTNQEMEGHLSRKKKHIDQLQGELKELRLKIQNHQTDLTFGSYASQDTVSSHVDTVLQAEKRYEDLEKILAGVQAERDQLVEEKSSQNKLLLSLAKENKSLTSSLKKHQRKTSRLGGELKDAKAEIITLQSNIQTGSEPDAEIMQELVKAKVSLAEMDEKLIKLRRDHHKSMARNMMLAAKATRLERILREFKHEKSGFIRKRHTKSLRLF